MSLLDRLSIRARLILLSILLIAGLVGTNLYLIGTLNKAAEAAIRSDRIISRIEIANDTRSAFANLRYWMTDLAVSLLTQSERNAEAARARLDAKLRTMATFAPETSARIDAAVDAFDAEAAKGVEAYTNDQRVIGNSLTAEARRHGLTVDKLLSALDEELTREAHEARDLVLRRTETATSVTVLVASLAILLGMILTVLVLRSILVPLRQLVAAMREIVAGRLDTPLPETRDDEVRAMVQVVALLRDAQSERQRLAAEAERQRLTLVDAVASMQEGFALYDAEDRVVLSNARYGEVLTGEPIIVAPGTSVESLIRNAAERGRLHGQETDAERAAWVAQRLAEHRSQNSTIETRMAGRWVQITKRRTHDGGTVTIVTDITDLKRREFDLDHARAQAEQANQVKSEFLANMSHELRTPLNAIIGYSQMLREDADSEGNRAAVDDLTKIEGAGNHLLGLINDILDLSKIEAGKMDVFIETVPVPSLLKEVQALVEPLVAKNGNRLSVACADDVGTMRTDATKLKQNLLNLLSNAAKFTKDGLVSVDVRRDPDLEGNILFSVGDTGIGLSEEQIGRLFQAFQQADNSTTRKFGGSGLGLTITRSFARMLGGDVRVTSTLGRGSTFALTLPADPALAAGGERGRADGPADAPRARRRDGRPPTILVVDDDAASRQIIGSYLVGEGFQPIYAETGPQALELARTQEPDVITLDIVMPQTDGWSVLQSLKSDPNLADIPVILVSMVADKGLGFSLGASAVLIKPVDRGQLAAAIKAHCVEDEGGGFLIVEDDPPMQALTARTVERLGFSAAVAGNGREALDWLAAHGPPRMILLDLLMPVMNGFEFLRELRARPELAAIPVIVLTAKSLEEAERAELQAMTERVIAKGQSAHLGLKQVLQDVLATRGLLHSAAPAS